MYYVYTLLSTRKKWLYIGSTGDLRKRLAEHQKGKVQSTKPRRPFKLIYYEAYLSKIDARKREIELKAHGQKKEFLLRQIENSIHMAPSSSLV